MHPRWFVLLIFLPLIQGFSFPDLSEFFSNLSGRTSKAKQDVFSKTAESGRSKRQSQIGDEKATDPWEVVSSNLPMKPDRKTVETQYMPTLSNGHIGTAVFSDSIYMEGLYNGRGANTHRAKIPPTIMARVNFSDSDIYRDENIIRKYSFNARYGIFCENVTTDFALIQQQMYMHQKYIRVFIVDLYAQKRNSGSYSGGGVIHRKFRKINETNDIKFLTEPQGHNSNWQIKGKTMVTEDGSAPETVSIFWTDPVEDFTIRGIQPEYFDTLVMAIDRHEGNARSEFDDVIRIINSQGPQELLRQHMEAWNKVWDSGRIEIAERPEINKISNFAQYYLLSNMPAMDPQIGPQEDKIFTGVGRTGLAWGGENDPYKGHVMWDNEMYILPAILLFHPETFRKVLRYRTKTADAARNYAAKYGGKGMHYPWESAASGQEVSSESESCPHCAWRKYHTTGAVAWAIRQYYSATRDDDYSTSLLYNGCDISPELAHFMAGRAEYNPEYGRYDLANVTGPDERYPNVANNAYTVVLASLAIHWARYYACICNRASRDVISDDMIHRAILFNLPFDNIRRVHYAYKGFELGGELTVSQADTIMLTYPLNWNMSYDIMKNDLLSYELLTDLDTPAMTWSFFAIGFKMVKETFKMTSYFAQSYDNYLQQPFKIWTEYGVDKLQSSAVNFLPGAGAFLQSIVYGFAGIRIRPQALEFHNPQPPPGSSELRLWGLKYLGNKLNINISQTGEVNIEVIEENYALPLILQHNDTVKFGLTESLNLGAKVTLARGDAGFYIFTAQTPGCQHPRDYIFMPWGYGPPNDSMSLQLSLVAMTTTFIATLLISFGCL